MKSSRFSLLASRFSLMASGFWLLATGCSLLATRFWLLASGFWLLARRFPVLFFTIFLISTGIDGFAQVNLKGTVKDNSTGKTLSGANIVIENTFISTSSDEKGNYKITGLKPLHYNLKLSFMGFKTISKSIVLRNDTILDFEMELAALLGEEVNIIATRAQSNTPTTFTTITMKEIQKLNTGQDLTYILQTTPSVVTTSDAGTGIGYTGMNIRGTDLTGINVTMNGIPVNDAESQGVWFVDLPDISSSTQNIQIQRGVGTSTNGAGAFGATVNIQTSNSSPEAYGELNATGGSFNTFKSTFRFGSGMINNRFAFDGRISFITSDGYIDRASTRLNSFLLSGCYLKKSTTVKFNILSGWEKTYQAWEGVPKDSLATNRTYNPAGEYLDQNGHPVYYQNQTDNYNQTHYQLLFSQEVGTTLNLNAALFYTKGKGYYENYKQAQLFSAYDLPDVILGNDTLRGCNMINQKWLDNDYYGVTFSGNYHVSNRFLLTTGGAWSNYYGKHFGKVIWAEYASTGDNDRHWYDNIGKKMDFNIFLKAGYQVMKKLNLFIDLQYRYVNYRISGDLETLSLIDQSHLFNFFNPKAGISFHPDEKQNLYFSFSVANREPNRNDYEVVDSNYMPSPERLYDYELGYNLKLTNFTTGICLYYMNYHDQLVLTGKINSVGEAIRSNVPESYRAGIELTAGANIFKWMKWNFTSTFSINKIKNFTEYVDNYDSAWNFTGQTVNSPGSTNISFSPGIIATNQLTFIPLKNLNFTLTSRFVGRQFIDNTSNKSRSLDPYFVNGISLIYDLHTPLIRDIGFKFMVNNLFSSKYETNAWVYQYNYAGQPAESNGYFPQALINFMVGISLTI